MLDGLSPEGYGLSTRCVPEEIVVLALPFLLAFALLLVPHVPPNHFLVYSDRAHEGSPGPEMTAPVRLLPKLRVALMIASFAP